MLDTNPNDNRDPSKKQLRDTETSPLITEQEASGLLSNRAATEKELTDDEKFIQAIAEYEAQLQETRPLHQEWMTLFNLNEKELEKADININVLKTLTNQNFVQALLRFFASHSLARAFFLLLVLSRDGIKSKKRQEETETWVTEETVAESSTEDSAKVQKESKKKNNKIPSTQGQNTQKKSRGLICTFSSAPVESVTMFRTVQRVNAFYETGEVMVGGVWQGFLFSLLINALVNYYRYPEERDDATLGDVFGLTSLLNIICIKEIAFFRNYLCFEVDKSYNDILMQSLDRPYIWPFLVGLPLLASIVNAATWQNRHFNTQEIQKIQDYLRTYTAGFWRDGVGWVVSILIPDFIPPTLLLAILPQPAIRQALESIKNSILWDGNLKPEQRRKLFVTLREFSRRHHKLTQIYALSALATIVNQIDFNHFNMLHEEGVDAETIKAFIYIKTEGFRELRFLAKNYQLPKFSTENKLRPLLRYLFANYVLWCIGLSQNHGFHPLFLGYKLFKFYFTLMFYKTLIQGVINIINQSIEGARCRAEGKNWDYFNDLQQYLCHVCGIDWPIYYKNIYSIEDCFAGLLALPRPLDILLRFTKQFDLTTIKVMDLSSQLLILNNMTAFKLFLQAVKPKLTQLQAIFINITFEDIEFATIIAEFLHHTPVNVFYCSIPNVTVLSATLNAVGGILAESNISTLVMGEIKTYDYAILNVCRNISDFIQSLSQTNMTYLMLGDCYLGDEDLIALAESISNQEITTLGLSYAPTYCRDRNCDFSAVCKQFTNKLPLSLQQLVIEFASMLVNFENCTDYFAATIPKFKQDFALNFINRLAAFSDSPNYISNQGLRTFAKALRQSPYLRKLILPLAIPLQTDPNNFEGFLELINAIPSSNLIHIEIFTANTPWINFSYPELVAILAHAINNSKIVQLRWSTYSDAERFIIPLADYLPNYFSKLVNLDLSINSFRVPGMKALANVLNQTNIEILNINSNYIGDEGVNDLAEVLPQTKITELYMNIDNITEGTHLAQSLPHSKIKFLNLLSYKNYSHNCLYDVIDGLPQSPVEVLNICFEQFNTAIANKLINVLTPKRQKHGLWIDALIPPAKTYYFLPKSNLTQLGIYYCGPSCGDESRIPPRCPPLEPRSCEMVITALCDLIPKTNISLGRMMADLAKVYYLYDDYYKRDTNDSTFKPCFNSSVLLNCGLDLDSASNRLTPQLPYLLIYRLYQLTQQTLQFNSWYFGETIREKFSFYFQSITKFIADNEMLKEVKYAEFNKNANNNILDATMHRGHGWMGIDFNHHVVLSNNAENPSIFFSKSMMAFKASQNNHHLVIGGNETHLDMTLSQQTNLIYAGLNNQIHLGLLSRDHVVITENRGNIQIHGFEAKDNLHLIATRIFYSETSQIPCTHEISNNHVSQAVLELPGTTVHLLETSCETVKTQIKLNDEAALGDAHTEMMQTFEHRYALVYEGILELGKSFIQSMGQAALMMTVPRLVSELFYRIGSHTHEQAENFALELQQELTVAFSYSPYPITASYLAGWITSRLIHSPGIVTAVSLSAALTASAVETLLTQNISFGWLVLQTGVILLGSIVGSVAARQLPKVSSWGVRPLTDVKNYCNSNLCFWKNPQRELLDTSMIELNKSPITMSSSPALKM